MAEDKNAGYRHSVARAMWRRRGLADKAADELELFKGPAGKRWWLGRRRPRQRLLWPPASRRCRPDGGAVGRQGGLDGSYERMRSGGAALQASKGRGATQRPEHTHVQNARSGRA